MSFFKPEDFAVFTTQSASGRFCDLASERANRILEERGVRVYSDASEMDWNTEPGMNDTHTALLIGVEPITTPDPQEELYRDLAKRIGKDFNLMEDAVMNQINVWRQKNRDKIGGGDE